MTRPSTWLVTAARVGYGARGVVYVLCGGIAVYVGLVGGDATGKKGALRALLDRPFGSVLLGAIALGFVCYAGWRFVQSLGDADDHGTSLKGLSVRGGLLASGVTYSALALYAGSLLFNAGDRGDGGSVHGTLAGWIGSTPAAFLLCAVFLGVTIAHGWKAYQRKYRDHLRAGPEVMKVVDPISVAGLLARGVVVLIVALLFGYRAVSQAGGAEAGDPGLAGAMRFVRDLPAGGALLIAMGLGLVTFAAYSLAEAVWRKIDVPDALPSPA
ncbi:MAG: DUF1206 domain-containing protein [Planctomycetota bacterium]